MTRDCWLGMNRYQLPILKLFLFSSYRVIIYLGWNQTRPSGITKGKKGNGLPNFYRFLFYSLCYNDDIRLRIVLPESPRTKKDAVAAASFFPAYFLLFWLSHHVSKAINPGASRSAHNEPKIENIPSIRNHLPSLEGDFIILYFVTGRLVTGRLVTGNLEYYCCIPPTNNQTGYDSADSLHRT